MDEQLQLTFSPPKKTDPKIGELVAFLKGRGWMTAKDIETKTGWDERKVRRLASSSDEIISYPGSPGYKLLSDVTVEEYHHFRNSQRSQARQMISRVIRADRRFFKRTPAAL